MTWIRDCNQNHKQCRSVSSSLPTRVLDVARDAERVYVYETSSTDVNEYICLSYCWGDVLPVTTTLDNIGSHCRDGISIEDALPLTFREAVIATRALGCSYLWIDALCIIQDDTDDWSTEASRMAGVYSGASITLVAAASRDSTGGLFQHYKHPSPTCELMRSVPTGGLSTAWARRDQEHLAYITGNATGSSVIGPCFNRAWCFQGKSATCPKISQ